MILREVSVPSDPSLLFESLAPEHEHLFLLQSAEGPRRFSKYSFLGFDPLGVVRIRGERVEGEGDVPAAEHGEAPETYLRRLLAMRSSGLAHTRLASPFPFAGGLVGYAAYEYVNRRERLPPPKDASGFADFEMGLYLDGIVYFHETGTALYFSHGEDRSREVEGAGRRAPGALTLTAGALRRNVDEAGFHRMVERAKGHIFEGDVFQVVLSKRFEGRFEGSLLPVYRALLRVNPSPYMYFLKMGRRQVVGSSPEMLVRTMDGTVDTFPIAGTRPVGKSPDETAALAAELLRDPKELAEHAMLVDLARNDVGRVSDFGSVHVPEGELRKVERYSHVLHIVSRVSGRLKRGLDPIDAFNALYPAGTVSGAPKVRAMEIIRDLEPSARGAYAGAVGYFSFNGTADAAIGIRTLTAVGDRLSVQAGAGIVQDSVPEREWQETEAKARVLTSILEGFA